MTEIYAGKSPMERGDHDVEHESELLTIKELSEELRMYAGRPEGIHVDPSAFAVWADAIDAHLAKAADYERAVTEQAMLTECVSVTGRDPSDVISDIIQWHVSNATRDIAQGEVEAWMHPTIISFKGVLRTSCPVDVQPEIEGTVAWHPEIYGDSYEVTDKHGFVHRPYPLYAQPRPVGVPDGYRLVPVEPTVEMLMAGRKQTFADMRGEHMGPSAENTYKVMLAAAPDGEVG